MGREEQIINERLRKLKELRAEGINPYPHKFEVKYYSEDLQQKYKKLNKEASSNTKVKIAGRLMTIRDLGKITFASLQDSKGEIQLLLQEKKTPDKIRTLFKKFIDSGDFVGVEGTIFRTKRGELSILVKNLELLSKSILPLPEKWHGLQDKEERYRKRHLDLLMSPEVKETFKTRSKIISIIRNFLKKEDFLEVETPNLQSVYGGASAAPFKTHLNALDIDLFLSISPELYLKKLIVGGYDRVFTISKNFRNEGIDRQHNPEFTMMEYYAAYQNYEYHIKFTEELFNLLRKELRLSTIIEYQGKKINLKTPFKRVKFRDLILKETGIDIDKTNIFESLKNEIEAKQIHGIDVRACLHYGALIDELYKKVARPKIIQPTFLTHYPVEMIALAKRNEEDKTKINTVQLLVDGAEIVKSYDELNDPIDQEKRLREQAELLKKGDDSAMPLDESFIEALKTGMPPTAGYGLGIDRLTMLLTNSASIRDVILFPFMRSLDKKGKND
jgi:lysyl-tRNA synthetase, class II